MDVRPGFRSTLARAGRRTNLGVLMLLVGAFATGWIAFATAQSPSSVLAAGAHGLCGLGLVVLAPWKSMIIRRSRRWRPASVILGAVVLVCLGSGFVELFGGYGTALVLSPIQVHVGAAVAIVPLVIWHALRHRRQRPARTDLSRRSLLQTVTLLGGALAGYAALAGAAQLASRTRAGTGSRPLAPAQVPATSWLVDRVPLVNAATHVVAIDGTPHTIGSLRGSAAPVRARLDCTSGWYADATWTGVALSTLLDPDRLASSTCLRVRSTTGYARTFPVAAAGSLWLATGYEGCPLSAGRGAPVRLVAPGYRGYWWVKWVVSVELLSTPSWRQLPFPV